MTLALPFTLSSTDAEDGTPSIDRVQSNFDEIAKQFPVSLSQATQVPQARVHRAAVQTITTATLTAITFDTEDWDTAALHDNAVNPTRLTANLAGLWRIDGHCSWVAAAGGVQRYAGLRVNGATVIAEQVKTNSATLLMQTSVGDQYRLAAGDYVELIVFQDAGGNLNATPSLAMSWASP